MSDNKADRQYQLLVVLAIILMVGWLAWTLYDSSLAKQQLGDQDYSQGNRYFEDGLYQQALDSYETALRIAPHHEHAWRGKALAYMQLGQEQAALQTFHALIASPPKHPAPAYANRGILYDRMGLHEKALQDYQKALRLDARMAEGPSWITRFFRLQPQRPPTIADRATYLQQELAKPLAERQLRKPEEDDKQRPYKQS